MRKYYFNESFFEEIDDEYKAYWLGFISADGCIVQSSEHSKRLSICLASKDREHLVNFAKTIGVQNNYINKVITDFERSVMFDKGKEYTRSSLSRIYLNSNKLCEDLEKLGVTQRKTNTLQRPNIREDLIPHYIRGFIDGDGHFGFLDRKGTKSKCYRYNFEVVGNSLDILLYIKEYFENYDIELSIYTRKTNNSYRLCTGSSKKIYNLLNIIYKDCNIYLPRKYDIFMKLNSIMPSQK